MGEEVTVVSEVMPVMSSEAVLGQMANLKDFVSRAMNKGTDYGTIPGTPKPTLLKPGAEKLCDFYGMSPTVEVLNRVEDWESALFHYEVCVTLISRKNGMTIAQGIGSANIKEKRYQKTIAKTGDPFSLVNTIEKMAKKRALVDAVLSATRTSGMFTQDIEDSAPAKTAIRETKPAATYSDKSITEKQLNFIGVLCAKKGYAIEDYMATYQVDNPADFTADQADEMIKGLTKLPDLPDGG